MPKSRTKGSILPESILEAATRLFIEHGFDGTSMYQIAEALGVTRTAVYYYYKNKEAILVALTDNITRAAAQLAEEAVQHKHLPPAEALRALVDRHARLIINNAEQFRVVERNEDRLPPRRRQAAEGYRRGVLANFTAVIERGMKEGVFRPTDARIAAFAILGMCNWTAWWFKPSGRKSRDEVAEVMSDFAVYGLKRSIAGVGVDADLGEALRTLRKEIGYLEERVTERAD
jgi:AcrR family transcriptional regulator